MDYAKQSNEEQPFEGLSLEEKKRLWVYMCHIAHPNLSPEDVERKWGKALSDSETPTVFEALELAKIIRQEISVPPQSTGDNNMPANKTSKGIIGACISVAIAMITFTLIILVISAQETAKEQRRKQKDEVVVQFKQKIHDMEVCAESVLSNDSPSIEALLQQGQKIHDFLAKSYFSTDWDYEKLLKRRGMSMHELLRNLRELLLKCYNRASEVGSSEADYRLGLLYSGNYRVFYDNKALSLEFLQRAARRGHYSALYLVVKELRNSYIDLRSEMSPVYSSDYVKKRDQLTQLNRQLEEFYPMLANHKNASDSDIYDYARWISRSNPDESLRYLKRAAKMGNGKARDELLYRGVSVDTE